MEARNVVDCRRMSISISRGGVGKFEATRLDEVGASVVRGLLARNPKVKPTMIDEFGIGNGARALDLSSLNNISRLAGLPYEVTRYTDRHCASSMEAFLRIAMAISLGQYECGIAFGVERMTREIGGGRVPPPTTPESAVSTPRWLNQTRFSATWLMIIMNISPVPIRTIFLTPRRWHPWCRPPKMSLRCMT